MRTELPSGRPAALARPAEDPVRGLVLVPDALGLRPLFDDMCDRLAAEHGWVVCAIEPFPGNEHVEGPGRVALIGQNDDELILGELAAVADLLGTERTAVMGFCQGGMWAFKAAGIGRFDRAVAFYGMVTVPWLRVGHAHSTDFLTRPGRGRCWRSWEESTRGHRRPTSSSSAGSPTSRSPSTQTWTMHSCTTRPATPTVPTTPTTRGRELSPSLHEGAGVAFASDDLSAEVQNVMEVTGMARRARRILVSALLMGGSLVGTAAVHAPSASAVLAVMNFDDLAADFSAHTSYSQNGLNVAFTDSGEHFHTVTRTSGTAAEFFEGDGSPATFSTGGPFDFTSVDIMGFAGAITFTATPGGATAAVVGNGVLSFPDGFKNITTVTMTQTAGSYVDLDNINFDTESSPAVTIDQSVGQNDPTLVTPIKFTATFSEDVTGFTGPDVDFTGSTAGGTLVADVTGGPMIYTVAVSGMTTAGLVVASIGAGAAVDSASNPSLASTSTDNTVELLRATSLPAVVTLSTNWALRNTLTTGGADSMFSLGTRPLVPISGDWDGDGVNTAGYYKGGTFFLRNTNSAGAADITFAFGDPRGYPVSGDFNGDGLDDVLVYRESVLQVRLTGSGATSSFNSGFGGSWPNVVPVAGDWNGDGVDGFGFYCLTNTTCPAGLWGMRNTATEGDPDAGVFSYTVPNNPYPVVGDWDANGTDTVGFKTGTTPATWFLRNTNSAGAADISFDFGSANDLPVVWGTVPPPV